MNRSWLPIIVVLLLVVVASEVFLWIEVHRLTAETELVRLENGCIARTLSRPHLSADHQKPSGH
jgi:hypothetical protein